MNAAEGTLPTVLSQLPLETGCIQFAKTSSFRPGPLETGKADEEASALPLIQ